MKPLTNRKQAKTGWLRCTNMKVDVSVCVLVSVVPEARLLADHLIDIDLFRDIHVEASILTLLDLKSDGYH